MTLHVLFTENGIPGWIGDKPREGSEALPDAADRRRGCARYHRGAGRPSAQPATGRWVKRPKPPAPTAEGARPSGLGSKARRAERQKPAVLPP